METAGRRHQMPRRELVRTPLLLVPLRGSNREGRLRLLHVQRKLKLQRFPKTAG